MKKTKKTILAITGVIILSFLIPFVISFTNARLYYFAGYRLTSWDTNIAESELNTEEFEDARYVYDITWDNPSQGIWDIILVRRMRIIKVDCAGHSRNNNYHIQFYTYFNIPLQIEDFYIDGVGIRCK